jgi:hypothetical protein
MAQKTKILYEFRQIQTDQILVLDNPASVWFQMLGFGGFVTINNNYRLQSFQDSNSPAGLFDWQLKLDNNVNELDVTNYVIRFAGTGSLNIIIKYYEQPDK